MEKVELIFLVFLLSVLPVTFPKRAISDILRCNMTKRELKKYGIFADKSFKKEMMEKYKCYVPKFFFICHYSFIGIYFLVNIYLLIFPIPSNFLKSYREIILAVCLLFAIMGFKVEKGGKTTLDYSRYAKGEKKRKK